jgi:hypothetical protein
MKQRALHLTFVALLCFFFAEVYAAQVLGLLGIYRAWAAIPLTLLLTAGALWLYLRWDGRAFINSFPAEIPLPGRLDTLFFFLGAGFFLLFAFYPVTAWPHSIVSETLHWDAGAYHFPKAVELFKTGGVWDLSIPYGEFPFGYESLLSFALLLAGDETFFGAVHALIGLFFILGVWLLARRYTRLPGGLLLFGLSLVFLSELYLVQGNPFYILLDQVYMIGKNDLFLAAGVLAAVVHAPVSRMRQPASSSRAHLPGLVFATLLVLASKPAGMFVVAPLWLPVLWGWWKDWRARGRFPGKELAFSIGGILPGGLWVVRNLTIIHTIFPEGVWVMNEWSIANNLTNPFFYAHLPRNFIFLLAILALALAFTLWKRTPGWRVTLIFFVLFIAFLFTPESGFQKTTQEPTRVAWRLGLALVAYELVVLVTLSEMLFERALAWLGERRAVLTALAGILVLASLFLAYDTRGSLALIPANEIVLRDEFRQPVGVDGYHSPYDYVQRNIHGSIIEVNGGVFYYIYGPGYTNIPIKRQYPLGRSFMVRQLEPEYYVVIPHGDEFPITPEWEAKWRLLYRDQEGLVFERK